MNFDNAIAAHVAWKTKFRTAITEKAGMDAAVMGKDNLCPLGKWLHGEARAKYAHLADLSTCIAAHAAFHREAGRIASLINDGQYDAATSGLDIGSAYAQASMNTTVALTKLRREIGA